eukprot:TRINITY_DN650_c0_g1_i1.p1 TRINITY_DN650_c0_g1~~TRINITY_DN650_c0_g1_i1.p1  ORF type:complete len:310 (-),score=79.47 TRINITY_DN650_c0_g1_i1:143-1072(-)
MGMILSLLKGSDDSNLQIDFEHAVPNAQEAPLYNEIQAILQRCAPIINNLAAYEAKPESIKKALSFPTPESENKAFLDVRGNTEIINSFYLFSKELEASVPRLLTTLITNGDDEKQGGSLIHQQALAKQLADIFDFVLKFDELKQMKPGLQNDFSYYRRSMGKRNQSELILTDEDANFISLFLASPIPMMNAITKGVTQLLKQREALTESVLQALGGMANICCAMVANNRVQNPQTIMLCLRAMTGAIVLFDHVNPTGVFRRSLVSIKRCCEVLMRSNQDVRCLANVIKYSTKHFNDEDTPDNIKELFE